MAGALANGQCGLTDGSTAGQWRLPTIKELARLVDYRFTNPALSNAAGTGRWAEGDAFSNAPSLWEATYGSSAGMRTFHRVPLGGRANGSSTYMAAMCLLIRTGAMPPPYVWPVRGQLHELPLPRFVDNGNGTVTDMASGLIWLKNASCFGSQKWEQAMNSAKSLADGQCGLTDGSTAGQWRLPSIRMLKSLISYNFFGPALSNAARTDQWQDGDAFSGVPFSSLPDWLAVWSSSTEVRPRTRAWTVDFYDGAVAPHEKLNPDSYGWPMRRAN